MDDLARLLGQYIDAYHQDPAAARRLLDRHRGNRQLHELARNAREVIALYREGWLPV